MVSSKSDAEVKRRVVFVCGIAGVGKSFLIKEYVNLTVGAAAWSASEIIGEARKNLDQEYLRNLAHDELRRSQELLLAGFQLRISAANFDAILLDGHSVIDNDAGMFPIPAWLIGQIAPRAIIHVEDEVTTIFKRRMEDIRRPRPPRNLEQLAAYQQLSLEACHSLRAELGIVLNRVRAGSVQEFKFAVDAALDRAPGHLKTSR
jgi:adenylate kinase